MGQFPRLNTNQQDFLQVLRKGPFTSSVSINVVLMLR